VGGGGRCKKNCKGVLQRSAHNKNKNKKKKRDSRGYGMVFLDKTISNKRGCVKRGGERRCLKWGQGILVGGQKCWKGPMKKKSLLRYTKKPKYFPVVPHPVGFEGKTL